MSFKLSLLAFVLQTCVVSLIEAKTDLEQKLNSKSFSDDEITSACGGIINLEFGFIRYKQFANLEPYERCVWILSPENTTGFRFYIEKLGLPSSLIITCISLKDEVETFIPDELGIPDCPTASVAIITFYTSTANFRNDTGGFNMVYGAWDEGRIISPFSTNLIVTGASGLMKYPNGRQTYDNNEISVFVITPISRVGGKFQQTDVAFTLKQLDSYADAITVFTFHENLHEENKWWQRGEIYNYVESDLISNSDLIMLIFRSDSTIVSSGFHLYTHSSTC